MRADEFLCELSKIYEKIEFEVLKKNKIKTLSLNATSRIGERVDTSPRGDKLLNNVVDLLECEENIDALIADYQKKIDEMQSVLNRMRDRKAYKVIVAKYIKGQSRNQIAYEMDISSSWVSKKIKSGKKEIQEILDDIYDEE